MITHHVSVHQFFRYLGGRSWFSTLVLYVLVFCTIFINLTQDLSENLSDNLLIGLSVMIVGG